MAEARRVLVIAGGEWQVPLVRKVRQMGYVVLNSNLYADSPAFAYADVTLVADVRDRQANLTFAREQRADAVLTDQSDIAVTTVAYVCEELGLPGIGIRTAELFTNKARMRAFCAQRGFPAVAHRLCHDYDEAQAFAEHLGFPCVFKPPSNQSSRGVARVDRAEDLAQAYANALANSVDGTVLVEQFIGGTELTVEGIKLPEGHRSLAVSRKWHYDDQPMVARRLLYSQEDDEIDYARLRAQHDRMIDAMGLAFGVTHAEYKYYRDEFYLVETAARGGGTRISSDIVPIMSGVDVTEPLIRMALGEQVRVPPAQPVQPCVALDFWEFAPGRVREVAGLAEVLAMPGVVTAGLSIGPGDRVRPPADDRQRHGFVIASAGSRPALEQLLRDCRAKMSVSYEQSEGAN